MRSWDERDFPNGIGWIGESTGHLTELCQLRITKAASPELVEAIRLLKGESAISVAQDDGTPLLIAKR